MKRCEAKRVALPQQDRRVDGGAERACGAGDGVEHGLDFARRAADHLEHVGGGGLLLQGLAQVVGALPQLVEQPRVLDGDNGLIGEILNQFDLLISEWAYLLSVNGNYPDQYLVFETPGVRSYPE